jgi:hypothetical protein
MFREFARMVSHIIQISYNDFLYPFGMSHSLTQWLADFEWSRVRLTLGASAALIAQW